MIEVIVIGHSNLQRDTINAFHDMISIPMVGSKLKQGTIDRSPKEILKDQVCLGIFVPLVNSLMEKSP